MEELWTRQRLEHRPRTEVAHGKWRTHEHPRIYRCHQIPRVQADSWKLRTAGQRPTRDGGQGALHPTGSPQLLIDGPVREETGEEFPGMGGHI